MPLQALPYHEQIEQALIFLRREYSTSPTLHLILGTGLTSLVDMLAIESRIPFSAIPHFPVSTAPGHGGELILGRIGEQSVLAQTGRCHFYEGYSAREVAFPVRVAALLGARTLIVTNSAGGLNTTFSSGALMVIRDHINLIPDNPLRGKNVDTWGPRFPDLSEAYDRALRERFLACAVRLGISGVTTGVYAGIPGPSLETPAETRYLRLIGADAVGMSTTPEVIVARHAGMRVLGVSVIGNINDPDNFRPILLEEVLAETEKASFQLKKTLSRLLSEDFQSLPA